MGDTYSMRQAAADAIGVHFAKVERLRRLGLIPEAVRIGRIYVFPTAKLADIRDRLIRQGHIKAEVVCGR